MTTIATDRRRIEAREDPEGERLAAEAAARYLDARLAMARALARIEGSGTFHLRGCSSAVQFAVKLGIPTADARGLVDLGHVLDVRVLDVRVPAAAEEAAAEEAAGAGAEERPDGPEGDATVSAESVEDRIRAGHVHVENAALVAKVLTEPGCVRPGEDWIGWASSMPTSTLRRCVNARLEEVAQGTRALLRIDLHVTARAREGFERARVVASREAGTILTQGQTFALVVDRYLDAFDELRRGEGARRVGPTSEAPAERYVPAAVRREVLARSRDRCEVPGCTFTTFLQMAHVRSHSAGGSREAENLLRLCTSHHTQLDAGCLVFLGWRGGRPVFGERGGSRTAEPRAGFARIATASEASTTMSGSGAEEAEPRDRAETSPTGGPTEDVEVDTVSEEDGDDESIVSRLMKGLDESDDEPTDDGVDRSSQEWPFQVAEAASRYGSRAASQPWTSATGFG